jgi:hypothetical protein
MSTSPPTELTLRHGTKTFPEQSKEQMMNAHKNCCLLRSLAAEGVI